MEKVPDRLFFRIGEVSEIVGVKPYVLRYWETEFPSVAPGKSASGQRVYRRPEVETLLLIKGLLYDERYSIEGARRRLRELKKEGLLKAAREKASAGALPRLAPESQALEVPHAESAGGESPRQEPEAGPAAVAQSDLASPSAAQGAGPLLGEGVGRSGVAGSELRQLVGELRDALKRPLRELFQA